MGDETVLVTSVGPGGPEAYNETTYSLEGETEPARLSPVALVEFLDIDQAYLPLTKKAEEQTGDYLKHKLEKAGVEYYSGKEDEMIPWVNEQDNAYGILETVVSDLSDIKSSKEEPPEVILDITHSFRSLSMVLFSSVMYLDALDEIELKQIYYGQLHTEDDDSEESPIIDLTFLRDLTEWHHALRMFKTAGSPKGVHQLTKDRCEALKESGETPNDLEQLVKNLGKASKGFDAGLPLEAGFAARETLKTLEKTDEQQFIAPEIGVFEPLKEQLEGFQLSDRPSEKGDVELTMEEIRREQRIVEFYLKTGRYWLAIQCARELFVNRAFLEVEENDISHSSIPKNATNNNYRTEWLENEIDRSNSTHDVLGGNRDDIKDTKLKETWMDLKNPRNLYSHCGFDSDEAQSVDVIRNLVNDLHEYLDNDEFWEDLV